MKGLSSQKLSHWHLVSADENVRIVANMTSAEIMADITGDDGDSSGDENSLGDLNDDDVMQTAAEIASAFATVCCFYRAVEGTRLFAFRRPLED